MKVYKYEQLPSCPTFVRLVCLRPGTFDDAVRLSLTTTQIGLQESVLGFEALSYTWGDARDRRDVVVVTGDDAEHKLSVTPSLLETLRYLRYEDSTRLLWIDAICINQEDLEERSQQVLLMPSIYRAAERVIVWLGPEADDSHFAFEALQGLGSKLAVGSVTIDARFADADKERLWLVERDPSSPLWQRELRAYRALLNRPWFSRVWIMQEIFLGKDRANVQCGTDSISWWTLRSGILFVVGRALNLHVAMGEDVAHKRNMMFNLSTNARQSFYNLLGYAQNARCTDPRDKVYGILGMLRKEDEHITRLLKPDYRKDVTELYMDVFHMTMETKRDHGLMMMERCNPSQDPTWRPTWATNWNKARDTFRVVPRQYADAYCPMPAPTRIDGRFLHVTGLVAAQIDEVMPFRMMHDSSKLEVAFEIRRVLQGWDLSEEYEHKCTTAESVTYALIVGLFAETAHPPRGLQASMHLRSCRFLLQRLSRCPEDEVKALIDDATARDEVNGYLRCAAYYCPQRTLVRTQEGYVALAPGRTRPSDVVAILLGLPTPVVLRRLDNGHYLVVGTCYCHGLNWGESLLGRMPPDCRVIKSYTPDRWYVLAFRYGATGEILELDPRVDWSGLEAEIDGPDEGCFDVTIDGVERRFRLLNMDYFTERGVLFEEMLLE